MYRECTKIVNLTAHRKKPGVISAIYSGQKRSSKHRKHPIPTYTKLELEQWISNQQDKFDELYDAWVLSGYEKGMKPSIDRLNDYKGYSLDNIQLMKWDDNRKKYNSDKTSGVNNKQNGYVYQYTLDGDYLAEFRSKFS